MANKKYKLVKRANPMKKSEPEKWYAIPVSAGTMTVDEVAEVTTRNTTLSRGELKNSLEALSESTPAMLLSGFSVRIGELGTLRLSFSSSGVQDIDQFDAASMIKNPKILFTPSKELKDAISKASFENAGVVEEGFTYPTIKAYKEFKVTNRDGSTSGGGSGSGEEQDENPLG